MILCCGEALVDMIPSTDSDGNPRYTPHPGGAVFNTANALGRLGAEVALLSGISTDPFGQNLAATLKSSGVCLDLLIRSDLPTALALVHLIDGSASYTFYDHNSAGRMITIQDAPALPAAVNTLFFGGISLVSEPAADTFADLITKWRSGRTTMLDPNIRPHVIQDEVRYRERLNQMIELTDILKVSQEDLDWFAPTGSTDETAHDILRRGPSVVIITKGEGGASVYTAEGSFLVPAESVPIVDTVGAGDTFNAGLLFELERSGHLSDAAAQPPSKPTLVNAVQAGAAAAAICCSRAGAAPPTIEELTEFRRGLGDVSVG
ncbi:MAG: carbohydrate kinase [Pseudomonadota bacterium]